MKKETLTLLNRDIIKTALFDALKKLSPRVQFKNPVMFIVFIGSLFVSTLYIYELITMAHHNQFIFLIALWLWFTTLFANFAEAIAEGRSKAQAAALKNLRQEIDAKKLLHPTQRHNFTLIGASMLKKNDIVVVEAGDIIPIDGEVIEGIASVDESAITGESAPVIRESGGDFSSVTGGTRIISDWLIIKVTSHAGETFLDRMITMVEHAKRGKTPNEIALTILLVALSIIFLLATISLLPFSIFSISVAKQGDPISLAALVALLVCLIPTTIGGLLSAIGVAGMSRMMQANVIANSGRAVEAAGDIDILLLDKTGTITFGNRHASVLIPAQHISDNMLATACYLSSIADETPEGRSIVTLAKQQNIKIETIQTLKATIIPFTAQTRMSGIDFDGKKIRKGSIDAIERWLLSYQTKLPNNIRSTVDDIAKRGSTPLLVAIAENNTAQIFGVIELKDIVKPGIRTRFQALRNMGIKTVMVTGDNPLTAAAIAAEAGVDDVIAQATPEEKLAKIRAFQAEGKLVAMTGDGTNDAPALAQADVAVAMNSGTQAAKEAGNMVDLDSNPTKLIEIVEIGKQMLMTRGALTTFSIANDVAKYFAIIPAIFLSTYPQLSALNIMRLKSPESAILSAVIFNALIIIGLVPLALKGVRYRSIGAAILLRHNLLIYGLGGLLMPFIGIKMIDFIINMIGLV